MELGSKEMVHNNEVSVVGELVEYSKSMCLELEERNRRADERCAMLEVGIANMKSDFESLVGKFVAIEVEKLAIEDEIRVLKQRNVDFQEQVPSIEIGKEEKDEEDMVLQLMIENKVLEFEKKRGESEVEVWKIKCKELESRVLELEESLGLRSEEFTPNGLVKVGLEVPDMDTEKMGASRGLKDGFYVGTGLQTLQRANDLVVGDERVHVATSIDSACYISSKGMAGLQASGMLPIDTPCKQSIHVGGRKNSVLCETELGYGTRVRKQPAFGEERSPNKKMAPPTPSGVRPASVGIIEVSDSEEEPYTAQLHVPTLEIQGSGIADSELEGALGKIVLASNNNLKRSLIDQSDEEDMDGYRRNFAFVSTPKRKKASNIVMSDSDSENDDDDNIPISTMLSQKLNKDSHMNDYSVSADDSGHKVTKSVARRRLVVFRNCKVKGSQEGRSSSSNLKNSEINYHSGIPKNEGVEGDEMEEDSFESEGESLGGFIVDNSVVSDDDDAFDDKDVLNIDDASGESEDSSDSNMNFNDIISQLRRDRGHNFKWEFEADMLADFGKDPELCMKAVCALYRQQTSDEKFCKGAMYLNQRGFSHCDAARGTNLAEFLTDGDPKGDLQKSVEELEEYDSKGIDLCRTLVTRYSKQLFAIYKNKEDPLFIPS